MAKAIQGITDQKLLDDEAEKAIAGFKAFREFNTKSEVPCVLNFEDSKFPMVASLDEQYFLGEQDRFVGQFYVLCKIQRKIQKGQNVKLDEIFDDFKNLPLNREQRRKMPKNINNPDIIRDVIRGPAMVVIPIAIYQ